MGRASHRKSPEHRQEVLARRNTNYPKAIGNKVFEFNCSKCGSRFTESEITNHLIKCQPDGVKCEICNILTPPQKALTHFKEMHK